MRGFQGNDRKEDGSFNKLSGQSLKREKISLNTWTESTSVIILKWDEVLSFFYMLDACG